MDGFFVLKNRGPCGAQGWDHTTVYFLTARIQSSGEPYLSIPARKFVMEFGGF